VKKLEFSEILNFILQFSAISLELISLFLHVCFFDGPSFFEFCDNGIHVLTVLADGFVSGSSFLFQLKLRNSFVEGFDVLVEGIVALTRLLGRLLEFLALVTVLLENLFEFDFFLELDFMLHGVSFSLLFNFGLLLVDLLVNLLLNVTSGIFLVSQLIRHLLGLIIDFSLKLVILICQVLVFLLNFVNCFLVGRVLSGKLFLNSIEMVFKSFFDFFALLPFLGSDLLVARFELFVLIIILSCKYFKPLFDKVSLLSAVNQNIDLLIEMHFFGFGFQSLDVDCFEESDNALIVKLKKLIFNSSLILSSLLLVFLHLFFESIELICQVSKEMSISWLIVLTKIAYRGFIPCQLLFYSSCEHLALSRRLCRQSCFEFLERELQ
jgi:hypothetical protein